MCDIRFQGNVGVGGGVVGRYTEDSDIDLIYELKEDTHLGLAEIYDLEMYFKNLFHQKKIDLVNKKYMNPIIEEEMMKSVIYVQ